MMATPTKVKDLPLKEVNQSQSGVDCKAPPSLDSQHNNSIETCCSTKCKAASPGLGIPERLKLPKPFKFPERYTSPTDHIISPISKGLRARSRRGGAVLPPSISKIHSQMATTSKKGGSKEIFKWRHEDMIKLCDTCIQFIAKYGRGQFFNWKEIQIEVEKKIGRECGRNRCKHKYDAMRRDWRLWKQLKSSETGLGWNHLSGRIDASDEWWQNKIKENKELQKFRDKGVDPLLEERWDQLFGDSYATGQNVYAPSMEPQAVNLEDDEDEDNNGDKGNISEEELENHNLDNDAYYQFTQYESALRNEDNFFADFVADISNHIQGPGGGSVQVSNPKEKCVVQTSSKPRKLL